MAEEKNNTKAQQNDEDSGSAKDKAEVKNNTVAQGGMDIMQLAAKLLENETSEEVLKLKNLILRRIATESDVKSARIPAPMNITEVGGYLNLLMTLDERKQKEQTQYRTMLSQALASILGLPMQSSTERD